MMLVALALGALRLASPNDIFALGSSQLTGFDTRQSLHRSGLTMSPILRTPSCHTAKSYQISSKTLNTFSWLSICTRQRNPRLSSLQTTAQKRLLPGKKSLLVSHVRSYSLGRAAWAISRTGQVRTPCARFYCTCRRD